MHNSEADLKALFRHMADEAVSPSVEVQSIMSEVRRRWLRMGSAIGILALLLGVFVLTGGSPFGGQESPSAPSPKPKMSSSPTISPTPDASPTPETSMSERAATQFGFGRVPQGWFSFCPSGEMVKDSESRSLVRAATASLLEAANSEVPDPTAMWSLLDPVLQAEYGSQRRFERLVSKAELAHKFDRWGIVHGVMGAIALTNKYEGQIVDTCGVDVVNGVLGVRIYFPGASGIADGAINLYFTIRKDGPKYWFMG